jgi:DNA mismatch repair protein MutL
MGKIRPLQAHTANQIAAGEVIERPASVVKELIENSLDAGATEIRVQVSRGGEAEIRVLDNGEGMDAEDLRLSLGRHATSKLTSLDELTRLETLGFRGEALPAIAAVSRLILESCPDDSAHGCRLRVDGGKIAPPETAGHPRGTTVTVRSLFFNAPARRKFLRSAVTESGHIAETLLRFALAHFDRRFFLEADGKVVLDAAPAGHRGERASQVFGAGVTKRLIPFEGNAGAYRVSGFASRPDFSRSSSRDVWLFVNGRIIRDRGLLHAVAGAYHTLLPRGRHPFALVFLEVPPERLDVNVHPAKWEVRLAEPGVVHETLRQAIAASLRRERPVASLQGLAPIPVPGGEPADRYPDAGRRAAWPGPTTSEPATWEFDSAASPPATLFDAPQSSLGRLVPLVQYRESYIIAADGGGLVIVDQHVAHERVLYEQLLEASEAEKVTRQALLFPVTLELDPRRFRKLEEAKPTLERLGFLLEPFGEASLLVREVPEVLGNGDVATLLTDMADDLEARGGTAERLRDRLAATTACHAAVKVNFPLTLEKMSFLLNELSSTRSPMTCPHGRPIVLRLAQRDLEKAFHRR